MSKFRSTALTLITLLILSTLIIAEPNPLAGKWEGKSSTGEIVKITFNTDNSVVLYRSEGGKIDGKVTPARFYFNFKLNKNANELDFTYEKKGVTINSIIEFIDKDNIKIGLSELSDYRPENFSGSESKQVWTLERKD